MLDPGTSRSRIGRIAKHSSAEPVTPRNAPIAGRSGSPPRCFCFLSPAINPSPPITCWCLSAIWCLSQARCPVSLRKASNNRSLKLWAAPGLASREGSSWLQIRVTDIPKYLTGQMITNQWIWGYPIFKQTHIGLFNVIYPNVGAEYP